VDGPPAGAAIVGRSTTRKKISHHPYLPTWGVNAIMRLAQVARRPGIYPATLIVLEDGRRQLVVMGGQVEDLGNE
jgi:hypothetical protein